MVSSCRLRTFGAVMLIGLFATGCSAASTNSGSGRKATESFVAQQAPAISDNASNAPLAIPAVGPCVYPSPAELDSIGTASAVVVEATVLGPTVTPAPGSNESVWTYPLGNVSVLLKRPGYAVPTAVTELGTASLGLLSPGKYILFLASGGGPEYYVAGGMEGAFAITGASTVERFCVNYEDPASPLTAEGSPPTLAAFMAELPSSLASPPAH